LGPVIGAADGEVFDVYLVILVIGGRSSCALRGFGEKMDLDSREVGTDPTGKEGLGHQDKKNRCLDRWRYLKIHLKKKKKSFSVPKKF
jgi:hypothetical protein